jgi:hypothetical protein
LRARISCIHSERHLLSVIATTTNGNRYSNCSTALLWPPGKRHEASGMILRVWTLTWRSGDRRNHRATYRNASTCSGNDITVATKHEYQSLKGPNPPTLSFKAGAQWKPGETYGRYAPSHDDQSRFGCLWPWGGI